MQIQMQILPFELHGCWLMLRNTMKASACWKQPSLYRIGPSPVYEGFKAVLVSRYCYLNDDDVSKNSMVQEW